MNYYAGDRRVFGMLEQCAWWTAAGKIVREGTVASEPAALIAWFNSLGLGVERIGLEAGPLSQWLCPALREAGLSVELLETRHVRDAFKVMPVKSDRNDARNIAQLMRLGWFRPVHCKSMEAQETRAVLSARKLLQTKLRDVENSVRGILRGFGLKVGKTTERSFALPASKRRCPAIRAWSWLPRRCLPPMRCCCASSTAWKSGTCACWRARIPRQNC